MIPFDEAYERMMRRARLLGTEQVPLADALGRILASDAVSDIDMPPFDKSAMDGFACRSADLDLELSVVDEIPAGKWPSREIGLGECARIMTGAPVPEGADRVVMVERTREEPKGRVRIEGANEESYICKRGEDVRLGDVVLRAGEVVTPAVAGMLAAVGCAHPKVAVRPRVAVLTTGSEIVEPEETPKAAQIRNTNGPQLCAQARSAGAVATYLGTVVDEEEPLLAAVDAARKNHDVLLLSGGVSAGDFDFVPGALEKLGFAFEFASVAMQPGRPTVFAVDGGTFCFGLPGNPGATFTVFELMVRPFLAALMGRAFSPRIVRATLATRIFRKRAERRHTLPVRFVNPGRVEPVEYHGSAHLLSLARAEGLVTLPSGVGELLPESTVDVRLL